MNLIIREGRREGREEAKEEIRAVICVARTEKRRGRAAQWGWSGEGRGRVREGARVSFKERG